ncbi:MAG: sulfotransferase domain-containing protein [Bacteroidales bacterium]
MKLLQIGLPKSGNYWLYNIIQQLYRLNSLPSGSFIKTLAIYREARHWDLSHSQQAGIDMMDIEREKCYFKISSRLREPIPDLDAYVEKSNHVWTHSEVCEYIGDILRRFNKLVYIYRDPRDVLVSAARFAFTPYMQKYFPHNEPSFEDYIRNRLESTIHDWIWHVSDYLMLRDRHHIHFIAYEHLLDNFGETAGNLARYLDLPTDTKMMEMLNNAVHFDRLKKKDPGHVKKGRRRQWAETLTDEQVMQVREMAGPLLSLLNYPEHRQDDRLPVAANSVDLRQIAQVYHRMKYHQGAPLQQS